MVSVSFLGVSIMRGRVARFPGVVAVVGINRLFVGDPSRMRLPLGVTVKARSAYPTNPLVPGASLMARVCDHDPVMQPWARGPKGI